MGAPLNTKLQKVPMHTPENSFIGHRPAEQLAPQEKEIRQLMDGVADQLLGYALDLQPDENLLICFHPIGSELCEVVRQKAEALYREAGGTGRVLLQMVDPDFEKQTIEGIAKGSVDESDNFTLSRDASDAVRAGDRSEREKAALHYGMGSDRIGMLAHADKVLMISNKLVKGKYEPNKTLDGEWGKIMRVWLDMRAEDNLYCIVSVPDETQAQVFGQTQQELWMDYLRACDRDWKAVEEAQAIAIERLTKAEKVTVTSAAPEGFDPEVWKTELTLDITEMIPANSAARRNMPGSEMFMAPSAESMNGQMAIPYPCVVNGKVVPRLVVKIENGVCVEFDVPLQGHKDAEPLTEEARQAAIQHMENTFKIDDGARVVGEFAIGTNPEVTKPTAITLLIEKTLGVHIAFGSSYQDKEYFGKIVNLDNGNRSSFHGDIALIMTPEYGGGTIMLDGDLFFQDGVFMKDGKPDPDLEILSYKAASPQE